MRKLLFIILALLLPAMALAAPPRSVNDNPVFPGAVGFGTGTLGAWGDTGTPAICVVNTPDWDAPVTVNTTDYSVNPVYEGGFESLIENTTTITQNDRVIIFAISGIIDGGQDVARIDNPNVSILGATAPSPGIIIKEGQLIIRASDVYVSHLRIYLGGNTWGNCDTARGITVQTGTPDINRVVIDHCTVLWGVDDNISLYDAQAGDITGVTISNSIVGEALYNSCHSESPHSMGINVSNDVNDVTLYRNILIKDHDRIPVLEGSTSQIINNVLYYTASAIKFDEENDNHISVVQGNFVHAPSLNSQGVHIKDTNTGSDIYVADLFCGACDATYATACSPVTDGVYNESDDSLAGSINAAVSLTSNPFTITPVSGDLLMDDTSDYYIVEGPLLSAGARPNDRDTVEAALLSELVNYSASGYVDYADIVYPSYDETTRSFKTGQTYALPASPHADTDTDGYTDMEEWYFKFLGDGTWSVEYIVPQDEPDGTETLRPTSDIHSNWDNTGAADYTEVDEAEASDADYVYESDSYQRNTYGFEDTSAASGKTINKVTIHVRGKAASGSQKIKTVVWDGADAEYVGEIYLSTSSYDDYTLDLTTDPHTGIAWTSANIDSYGFGHRTGTITDTVYISQFYIVVHYADDSAPTLSSTNASTSPNGEYLRGQSVSLVITFSEDVFVNSVGTQPRIPLNTTPTRYAVYAGGSGTDTWTFIYTVQLYDQAATLNWTGTDIDLNSGTIKNAAAVDATTTWHDDLTSDRTIKINGDSLGSFHGGGIN